MDSAQWKCPTPGPDGTVVWLDTCPPIQPDHLGSGFGAVAELGAEANEDRGSVESFVLADRSCDRRLFRTAGAFDGFGVGPEADVADSISHQERLELVYAAANTGVEDYPNWLILAVEKGSVGSAFKERGV